MPEKNIPPLYLRCPLTVDDIRRELRGAGWLTLTQLTARVGDLITPEAATRAFRYCRTNRGTTAFCSTVPLDTQILIGRRHVVRRKMDAARYRVSSGIEVIAGHGHDREPQYRYIEQTETAK